LLKDLIYSFDFDTNLTSKDYLFLKISLKSFLKNKNDLKSISELNQLFLMFGEELLFQPNQLERSLSKSGISDN